MAVIMGGIMTGVGIGMSISVGGSTGGTDIIALIYTKFRNVSPGKVILVLDVAIICSSLLVPSYQVVDGVETLVSWPDKVLAVVFGFLLVVIAHSIRGEKPAKILCFIAAFIILFCLVIVIIFLLPFLCSF